jgi:hypothetical protein
MLGITRHPVSAESNIAYEDFSRMHRESHAARQSRWVPPFALNDKQLRRVLLVRCWRYVHNQTPVPANLNWKELDRAATAHTLQPHAILPTSPLVQKLMYASHVEAVLRAGGYLEFQAAITYRSWRLGQDSVTVADSLGISPQCVRVNLQRLRDIGRMLGFDCGVPHPSFRSKRHGTRLRAAWVRRKQAAAKRQAFA